MSRQPSSTIMNIKIENTAPSDEPIASETDAGSCGGGEVSALSATRDTMRSFPEQGANPLRVPTRVGRNKREADVEIGCIRLKVLMPFAMARLGRSYEVWDSSTNSLVSSNASLTVKMFAKELASRLACGTDLIYKMIGVICIKGPENVVAEDMLKDAASGGKGTPRITAAAEARRLLERYGIATPDEIVLEDIAWDLGIEISIGRLSGAEAHMVRVRDVGTITVSDQLVDPGARRFAIAHELGHWQMHQAVSQVFFCTDSDMKEYRHSGAELEANTFASELLMPKAMIDQGLLSAEPTWGIIKQLSDTFGVAPISAAVHYVDLTRQPVMAVFSDCRNVKWWRENRPRMDGLWLESQQALAKDSVAYYHTEAGERVPDLLQVPWDAWFPHCRHDEEEELFELVATVDDRGTVMSLLWAPAR